MIITLTACGPVYQTHYDIIPVPPEKSDCANNCLLSKNMCEQQCHTNQQLCESNTRLQAQNDYLHYVNLRKAEGRPIKRTQSSFARYSQCNTSQCSTGCTSNYHICHTNCGGQVIPRTVCTAFCE